MVKDRLADLQTIKGGGVDDWDSFEDEVQLNIESGGGVMDEFFKEMEQLRELVDSLQADAERIKIIHSDILSAPSTDEKLQQELEGLMDSIKRASHQVRSRLKELETSIEQAEQYSDSPAEVRIRRTQYHTLFKKFVDVMTDYNNTQTSYREKCKGRIQRQTEIAGKNLGDEELEDILEGGNAGLLTDGIVMDTVEMKQTLRDIQARHEDIMKLENSLKDLHEMFVDMAVLVDSQGEMIDRIEVQVENAVEWVDRANADMKKAREYEAKARKKKLMMLVGGTLLGLLVVWYLKSKLGL